MLKNYIELVSVYKNKSFHLFKNTEKDRSLIHAYEWDNVDINYSILFEIELLNDEISGYASSIVKGNFTRCEQTLDSLRKKSIYDNEIILNWLTLENTVKYPDYYVYILFLENYRSLVLKVCEESNKDE